MRYWCSVGVVLLLQTSSIFAAKPLVSKVDSNLSFPFETFQLTDSDVMTLSSEDASTFGFPKQNTTLAAACKTFPTDTAWPSESKWKLLDEYTGKALIKTTPIGAPCYPGPLYDASKCAYITANWGNSSLQYEYPSNLRFLFC